MRLLFLSNTKGNSNPEVIGTLKSWLGSESKVAYIASSPDPARKYFADVANWFLGMGIANISYFDANSQPDEVENLRKFDAVYLSGGNTYHLLQALRDTGMGEIVRMLALESETPIIGVSAGGLCLTKDIRAATAENNIGITNHAGLGLVDFGFYPHYLPNETSSSEIRKFLELTNIGRLYALPEYSGLAVTAKGLKPLGEVVKFEKGSKNPEKISVGSKEI